MRIAVLGRVVLVAWAMTDLAAGVRAEPAISAERFGANLRRPLFSPTRRPPPPPAVIAAPTLVAPLPPVAASPSVALSGVIVGAGGGVALLRRSSQATPVRVALGGDVDGWRLVEIHPRSVVLRRDARSVSVELPAAGQ